MYKKALSSLSILYFMMGFITCLNDILVPFLKKTFHLGYSEASLVQVSFFAAYGLTSIPSSRLIEKIGYHKGIIVGFIMMAVGCLLFIPATMLSEYHWFLCALFVIASGIVMLQVAANPFVAQIGAPETASSRLSLVQAFVSLGTFIAPFYGAVLILGNSSSDISILRLPYILIAGALIVIAVLMSQLDFPNPTASVERTSWMSVLKNKKVILGMIGIFVYVGAEVSIGSFLVNYVISMSPMKPTEAANLVAIYWGGAMAGRFLGMFTLKEFPPGKVLVAHALIAISLILISINSHGMIAIYTMILVGFCNSIMFPTIFTLSIKGLESGTQKASGLLSTSILGGSLIPLITGQLADKWGLRLAMCVPLLCYVYIWLFGCANRPKALSTGKI
ncbi:MAG: sugar MFS transporter [Bdellovibrionota bacterium]